MAAARPNNALITTTGGIFPLVFRAFTVLLANAGCVGVEPTCPVLPHTSSGYFNLIVVTDGSNKCCKLADCFGDVQTTINAYLVQFPATRVVTVDGNDVTHRGRPTCHPTYADELARVDMHFMREAVPDSLPTGAQCRKPSASPWGHP